MKIRGKAEMTVEVSPATVDEIVRKRLKRLVTGGDLMVDDDTCLSGVYADKDDPTTFHPSLSWIRLRKVRDATTLDIAVATVLAALASRRVKQR